MQLARASSGRVLISDVLVAQSGLALSVRNLSTMGAIVFGTTVVSGMGTASLAAHEILRQACSRLIIARIRVRGVFCRVCPNIFQLGPMLRQVLPPAVLSTCGQPLVAVQVHFAQPRIHTACAVCQCWPAVR